jgi:hypothetical protein
MLRGMLIAAVLGLLIGAHVGTAQDCAGITKYGIFDVRKTSQQTDLADDLIKWLTSNDFGTEEAAKNAGMSAGMVIPYIDVPANSDNTYGENHKSSWSKAAADFLQTHSEKHSKFTEEFMSGNVAIVNAWKECVTRATGLICWATPTSRNDEVRLNIEVRPVQLPVGTMRISAIVSSPNLTPLSPSKGRSLNTKTISFLYHRSLKNAETGGNFTVSTNNDVYACSAEVASLPPPTAPKPPDPIYKETTKTVDCVVSGDDLTNEGVKVGDKTLYGMHCHSPQDFDIVAVGQYVCAKAGGGPGDPCGHLDRHVEKDAPNPPPYYPKKSPVNLRFATDGGHNITVTIPISYTDRECIQNCPPK